MARNKDYRETLRDANAKMAEWEDMDVVPESVEMFRQMLNDFYDDAGKNVKNPDAFSTRVQLTEDQEEELMDIAVGFLNENRASLDTYEDFLEDSDRAKTRERNDIHSLEDAIDFLDKMNDYQNDAFLSNVLSSDELLELYTEGRNQGFEDKEIRDMIYLEYSGSGKEGESLYNQIWEAIQDYDERVDNWHFD